MNNRLLWLFSSIIICKHCQSTYLCAYWQTQQHIARDKWKTCDASIFLRQQWIIIDLYSHRHSLFFVRAYYNERKIFPDASFISSQYENIKRFQWITTHGGLLIQAAHVEHMHVIYVFWWNNCGSFERNQSNQIHFTPWAMKGGKRTTTKPHLECQSSSLNW